MADTEPTTTAEVLAAIRTEAPGTSEILRQLLDRHLDFDQLAGHRYWAEMPALVARGWGEYDIRSRAGILTLQDLARLTPVIDYAPHGVFLINAGQIAAVQKHLASEVAK